jgi:VWFA-related protein
MPRFVRLFLLLGLLLGARKGFGQDAPGGAPARTAAAPRGPQAPVATIKANAQLVVVDVVVTDSSHRPVRGLTAADFSLTESGVAQTLNHFEEHAALTAADATKFAPMPKMPAGIFTNYTPAPANGAVNLILLDALNTPMRDQSYVRQQLLEYLKATPPGTRIAIFGLTSRLVILQGFTSDPDVLRAVMEKNLAKGSHLLDDAVGGGGIPDNVEDELEDKQNEGETLMDLSGVIANMRQFDAEQQSFQLQARAKYTLDAMNQIARYLSNIPGRKNLIWFSGSFPVDILPDTSGKLNDPFAAMASSEDEFRETVDLLARSQVAVYPIDARGLINSPMNDITTSRNYTTPHGVERMTQDENKFYSDTAEEHGTMRAMADATGGHAFVNTNGLTGAVASAIEQGSNFYTLTYTPTNSERDGKLRKISVKVTRPGLTLEYRKGYYADDPAKPAAVKVDAATMAGTPPTKADTLHFAMTRGVPTPSEVIIKVGVVPMTPAGQTEAAVATGNDASAKMRGPYRRYSVNLAIDPAGLTFLRMPDGKVHADFDLLVFVFNPEGELLNSQSESVRLAQPLEEIRKTLAKGLLFHQEVSAPAKGDYFLRIGVHEIHRDRYGAVEVATAAVKNVVPPKDSGPAVAK